MQEVTVYHSSQKIVFDDVQSDLLVSKSVQNSKGQYRNEVIAFTMYGWKNVIKWYALKGRRITIEYKNPSTGISESYIIRDTSDFDIKETAMGDFLKLEFKRIIKDAVDNEEDECVFYPLLAVTNQSEDEQKSDVYNMVRKTVSTPMLPNMEIHQILAAQMFIEKDEAKTLLRIFKGEKVKDISVDLEIFNYGKFLYDSYQKWKEHLYTEMKARKLIRPLNVVFSDKPLQVYELVMDEKIIESIIVDGVKSGKTPFAMKKQNKKQKIDGFNDYMTLVAPAMAKRIESLAKPIHRNGDITKSTLQLFKQLNRQPLSGQKDAIEACIKSMKLKGKVNLIGEMGIGKTYIMIASNWIYSKQKNQTMKLLVYCPDTLVKTVWEHELKATLKNCKVHIIRSVNDLIKFEQKGYLDDDKERAFILSHKAAKTGYTNRPMVHWSKSKQAFVCPDCGEMVMEKVKNPNKGMGEPQYIDRPVLFDHFKTERYNNRYCKHCESVLWGPLNKEETSYLSFVTNGEKETVKRFVYSSKLKGFYPNDLKPVKRHLEELVKLSNAAKDEKAKSKFKKEIEDYRNLYLIMEGKEKEGRRISPKKVSVAEYIFKKMRNRFTNLIVDEFHEHQGDSARSDACAQLIRSCPVVQTGTGTGMNGYAKSRFKTDYMMYPEKMKKYGFNIEDQEKYQAMFGVTEKRFQMKRVYGKDKKITLAPISRPGISPVIFPLFMQDTSVFISLKDLKDDLPELKHYQIEVEMDPELKAAKEQLESEIKRIAKHDKKLFRGSIQIGYSFLDSPTIEKELKDKNTGRVLLKTPALSNHTDNKIKELIKLAKNEVQIEKRRMIIYTYYTGDGINEYIQKHLQDQGFSVTVLNKQNEYSVSCDGSKKKVEKVERETFIKDEVRKGTEILIVNPELIKTGYNLIEFPTICYYEMGYQVYTNRQADRRSWRIGQTKECKIIYLYYKESIQQDVASLMATKIVASQAIEGNMDAAGLEAILQDRTAEEELAQKFFEGIRGKVVLDGYKKEEKTA